MNITVCKGIIPLFY